MAAAACLMILRTTACQHRAVSSPENSQSEGEQEMSAVKRDLGGSGVLQRLRKLNWWLPGGSALVAMMRGRCEGTQRATASEDLTCYRV